MTTSAEVRSHLIRAMQLDLVGPTPDDVEYAEEILTQAPSKWYLTGFLVPFGAPVEVRSDETADDTLEQLSSSDTNEDANAPEASSARKAHFPSSIGLSFLLPENTTELNITVQWGDYQFLESETELDDSENPQSAKQELWQRSPHCISMPISLLGNQRKIQIEVPDSNGLKLFVSNRAVASSPQQKLPVGTRSVSVFLVNYRSNNPNQKHDISFIFQACLTIRTADAFVSRPNLRGQNSQDRDEAVSSLQYRNDCEYAVGHNVSAITILSSNHICQEIRTNWMPTAEVARVKPAEIPGLELGMEALAKAKDAATISEMVYPMVTAYTDWITKQQAAAPTEPHQGKIASELLTTASRIKQRIAAGLQALDDPLVLEAFQIANQALATARRQRLTHDNPDKSPEDFSPPKWRPFQLAFLLLNILSIAQPEHPDREIVDLLFFPTGGGKTEAYLGLAAFTLVLRRLRDPSIHSAGVSVLMRYTLRLLTLDQLERAATLVCALELERQQNPRLGKHPFEIGLWVGQGATPNKMGKKGDKDNSAWARTQEFDRHYPHKPKPIPLERCPWCGTELKARSFQLLPLADAPTDLRVICDNRKKHADGKPACVFKGNNPLPIVAVDEQIYRRLPCFIISTVDKFANLPWVGQTGALFGKVTHFDEKAGFTGPADAKTKGRALDKNLPPPDLIIQDELHLISGPLGTMVGLYETVIDVLCSVAHNDKTIRPKIIASTATVRRAERQIQALFSHSQVDIFPPPGPDRHDSFFAETVPITKTPGRLYVGVVAQGRSLKVVLLRAYLALLGAAKQAWEDAGGKTNPHNPADPYMTLLGYFNSLRELGGSRRLVEDEVNSRLSHYGDRRRYQEPFSLFCDRKIDDEPEELTSRISTNKVANTKRRLALPFHEKERVDIALATNMISVGLDITRLGLMVVLGQPKTTAEYIQATSRVGREAEKPGLVVTLLNIHRPRDRSHYERFQIWHDTFYRTVEASSVTPFSPRAIDRGLSGVTVALARLGNPEMTAPLGAAQITQHRLLLDFVVDAIVKRAEGHSPLKADEAESLRQEIRRQVIDRLDTWQHIAVQDQRLQYQRNEIEMAAPLLLDALDPKADKESSDRQKFKAQRSLRDVEPVVKLFVRDPVGLEIEEEV